MDERIYDAFVLRKSSDVADDVVDVGPHFYFLGQGPNYLYQVALSDELVCECQRFVIVDEYHVV